MDPNPVVDPNPIVDPNPVVDQNPVVDPNPCNSNSGYYLSNSNSIPIPAKKRNYNSSNLYLYLRYISKVSSSTLLLNYILSSLSTSRITSASSTSGTDSRNSSCITSGDKKLRVFDVQMQLQYKYNSNKYEVQTCFGIDSVLPDNLRYSGGQNNASRCLNHAAFDHVFMASRVFIETELKWDRETVHCRSERDHLRFERQELRARCMAVESECRGELIKTRISWTLWAI